MERLFGKPLITQEAMRGRIKELGKQITNDYHNKDLILIGILKGAFAFYADLVRFIRLPIQIDFLIVKSQTTKAKKPGKVKVITNLTEEIKGRHVLLVEDIIDSGLTVRHLMKQLNKQKPKTIEVCALLSKPSRREVDAKIRYVGFEIPNHYVVGYGLDYEQKYRNLPYIAVLDAGLIET